jgi:acetyl-CoA C-acetyltransferase
LTGSFPVNCSGGVLSSNPIGASGLLRFAEAALQVRGAAGEHQVAADRPPSPWTEQPGMAAIARA